MSDNEHHPITLTLSAAQVDSIVRAASRGRAPSISTLISDSLAAPLERGDAANGTRARRVATATAARATAERGERGYFPSDTDDPRLSRSLLRGLSLLAGFGPDGGERGIVELADDLGMSPSTAHRYALTLVEIGLLERCPRTRKYRLPDAQ
jgi:IclR-like helix-turn-helix domain-containing protein